jgi:hypothetical protein
MLMASPTQEVRQKTGEVMGNAKETARSAIGEQKEVAASGLGEFAGCLRNAAREVHDRNPLVASVAEGAADRLQRLSGTLGSKDLDTIVRDTESFARREPMVFLGAAMVAGFIAIRFLKSSPIQNNVTDTLKDAVNPSRRI